MAHFEKLRRKKEKGNATLVAKELKRAMVYQVVPVLRQTLSPQDLAPALLDALAGSNTHCAYYALYFLHALQQGRPCGPGFSLPLGAMLQGDNFCQFFEQRLERQLRQRASLTKLSGPELAQLTADFQQPIITLCVPVFELIEGGDTTVELWQAEYPRFRRLIRRVARRRLARSRRRCRNWARSASR